MTTVETPEEFGARVMEMIDSASLAILLSIGHQTGLVDVMADMPSSSTTRTQPRTHCRANAPLLTRAAGPDNLARTAAFIPLLGEVEQKIIGCFRDGGGLSYAEYPRFHAVMAEASGEVFDAALVDVILPLAEGLPARLRTGADLADFGCGSGHAVNVMARRFRPVDSPAPTFPTKGSRLGATRPNVSA